MIAKAIKRLGLYHFYVCSLCSIISAITYFWSKSLGNAFFMVSIMCLGASFILIAISCMLNMIRIMERME